MNAYNTGAGRPSPFERFIRFPSAWAEPEFTGKDATIFDSRADLIGHQWVSVHKDTTFYSMCYSGFHDAPTGHVSKLLPDRVVLAISSERARLAVLSLMESWAPGQTVEIDGQSVPAARVSFVMF